MKRYPAYKESGIETLGKVPEPWKILPLKRFGFLTYGDALASEVRDIDGNVVVFGSNGPVGYHSSSNAVGPAILVGRKGSYGALNWSDDSCFAIDTVYFIDERAASCDIRWLYWTLHIGNFDSISQDTGVPGLSRSDAHETRFPVPSRDEQRAIADFLDRETAKIDALVEEQRRLIALLAEKRQAVISHAVTKGLNPTAPLKPSGIEWLGDIPEGWEVVPLKVAGDFGAGAGFPHEEQGLEGEELPFFKVNALGKADANDVLVAEVDTISRETAARLRATIFPKGTIVFAKIGAALLLGRIRTIPSAACLDNNMMGFTAHSTNSSGFLKLAMSTLRFDLIANPGTVPSLNEGQIANQRIALPPREEQDAICSKLQDDCLKLDELADSATSAIILLQERRAALISAAVTGKIDVREAVASVTASRQSLNVSAMIAGVVIAKLGRQPDHGRVWLQKMLFMAQTHANIDGIGGSYLRAANGPLDIRLRDQVEADLSAANAIRVTREPGEQGAYRYDFIGDAAQLRSDLATKIVDRMDGLLHLMDLLGDMGTKQIEAVATLYAAWNDFLIDGKAPSDADLIREVRENWHPAKKERLSSQYLADQLGWLRRQNIVPSGTGRKTYTDRLI